MTEGVDSSGLRVTCQVSRCGNVGREAQCLVNGVGKCELPQNRAGGQTGLTPGPTGMPAGQPTRPSGENVSDEPRDKQAILRDLAERQLYFVHDELVNPGALRHDSLDELRQRVREARVNLEAAEAILDEARE